MSRKNRKKQRPAVTGILSKHKKGFGFVIPDEGSFDRDIFISPSDMNGAMEGDRVEVDLIPEYLWEQSPQGIITKVTDRKLKEVAGFFDKGKKFGFVVPVDRKHNEDIYIPKKAFSGAKNGDIVVAAITGYPDRKNSAEGKITGILARAGEPGGDIKAIIRQRGLFFTFPSKAAAQAKAISKAGVGEQDMAGRRDLRGENIITIDGADSKDFDDAVSVKRLDNGNFLLGVHIADVSHYIGEDSPLDKEALKRGNSVYIINQVVPMLPKELSNGICSLNEGEERLTLSVDMEITPEGDITEHNIYESVIRSKHRMVYTDVSDIIENDDRELAAKYSDIYDMLMDMKELAQILRSKREAAGSLDFDLDEAYITLDEKGVPVSVNLCERRTANRMIEEFMLAANKTVAEQFFWLELPFVYRVHEKPDAEKMQEFRTFLMGLSIRLKGEGGNIHPKALNEVLEQVAGTSYENVVNTVMLRSMKKAFYSTECEGHFGLSMKYYCHFTSPIRRYPDLIIHRIIKEYLHGGIDDERIAVLSQKTQEAAETSSVTERAAIELERDVEKMKKAQYMSYHIGESFEGIISGITGYGMYVELENTIEGLVRLDRMYDDYYDAYPEQYRIVGQRTNKVYSLGQRVSIIVSDADYYEGTIDFRLC
ncbi:MAG: ribonuclease R [Eubacteriales bacterium]|nr:ribonuclease R [Clostridiales bacterium]MDD7306881.1 ribonuclease R [Eubacteriales bacterium]MDY2932935.1 ribonuclease R [Anaerovoracaceae bacterium]